MLIKIIKNHLDCFIISSSFVILFSKKVQANSQPETMIFFEDVKLDHKKRWALVQ